jgi:hypothetical protein
MEPRSPQRADSPASSPRGGEPFRGESPRENAPPVPGSVDHLFAELFEAADLAPEPPGEGAGQGRTTNLPPSAKADAATGNDTPPEARERGRSAAVASAPAAAGSDSAAERSEGGVDAEIISVSRIFDQFAREMGVPQPRGRASATAESVAAEGVADPDEDAPSRRA